MNPVRFWLAIIGLLGFAVVVPGWMYFTNDAVSLPPVTQWLVWLVLPMTVLLFMASWLEPGGA